MQRRLVLEYYKEMLRLGVQVSEKKKYKVKQGNPHKDDWNNKNENLCDCLD